jgi:hypothetical protein
MGSPSERERPDARQRPSPELLRTLRKGKEQLRRKRQNLPLPEKIRQVLDLQRLQHPLLAKRRPLRWWEHPWDVDP